MHEYTKVLVPANRYDFNNDKRLLIPFTSGEHIGFVNRNMEVVVQPKYKMIARLCEVLDCQPGDLMEYVKESENAVQ